ncbi:MAG TPA: HEPN domain-containing protein [Acetobacteraceae bacterium]|jgi:HEPN domain-containing protein
MSAPDAAELWQEVQGWLRVADNDRYVAQLCLKADPPAWEGAAYHCQQAAEKLLKGFLVRACADFGRTHDLEHLGERVAGLFPEIRSLVEPMATWTHWAIAYRYPDDPGPEPEPTMTELETALALVERLAAALRTLAPDHTADEDSPNQ